MKQELIVGQRRFSRQQQTGGFIILLGVLFMLSTSELSIFGYSPRILMAFLPLYWFAIVAYRVYQREGELNARVLISFIPMLIPFLFVGLAILGFNPGKLWPLGMIALGIVYIVSSRRN